MMIETQLSGKNAARLPWPVQWFGAFGGATRLHNRSAGVLFGSSASGMLDGNRETNSLLNFQCPLAYQHFCVITADGFLDRFC